MSKAVCSVSPIIFLYRLGLFDWLPRWFDQILMPSVVLEDLLKAHFVGYEAPSPIDLPWVEYEDPQLSLPSAWLSLDLDSGEVGAMALAFENPNCVVLLDEFLARGTTKSMGLACWGTLRLILEAKKNGIIQTISPVIDYFGKVGVWLQEGFPRRILILASENVLIR